MSVATGRALSCDLLTVRSRVIRTRPQLLGTRAELSRPSREQSPAQALRLRVRGLWRRASPAQAWSPCAYAPRLLAAARRRGIRGYLRFSRITSKHIRFAQSKTLSQRWIFSDQRPKILPRPPLRASFTEERTAGNRPPIQHPFCQQALPNIFSAIHFTKILHEGAYAPVLSENRGTAC